MSAPAPISSRKPAPGEIPEVGFVLEGTFPYVKGGVSSWIDQAVNAMPNVTFGVHFIGGPRNLYHGQVYKLGPNILAYEEDFLRGEPALPRRRATKAARLRFAIAVDRLIGALNGPDELAAFWVVSDMVTDDALHLTLDDLFATPEGWEVVRHTYNRFAQGESFLDFHYAFRNVAASLWEALLLSKKTPSALMYHSVCTGYAGMAAAAAARREGAKLFLTEHGLYVMERVVEISAVRWLRDTGTLNIDFTGDISPVKKLFIDLFLLVGRVCYHSSDRISNLFPSNTPIQVSLGAPVARIESIANGIDPAVFAKALQLRRERRAKEDDSTPGMVGFVGRVSRIKDVPTLIRAMAMVIKKRPGSKLHLVGPGDEEPDYYEECKQLARDLGIADAIDFAGSRKVTEELWKMDTLVLTSLSEGLPFVILEAFAVGIPCISTDVGSCRMVIEGNGSVEDDKPAGYITRVGMAHETADAILKLIGNRENCERMGQNGLDRVTSLYRQSEIMAKYETIYHELAGMNPRAPAPALKSAAMSAPAPTAPAMADPPPHRPADIAPIPTIAPRRDNHP